MSTKVIIALIFILYVYILPLASKSNAYIKIPANAAGILWGLVDCLLLGNFYSCASFFECLFGSFGVVFRYLFFDSTWNVVYQSLGFA